MIAATATPEPVVEVKSLTRHFGTKAALDVASHCRAASSSAGQRRARADDADLLFGLLKAETGSVRVFDAIPWPIRRAC